jgi:hypothetical protein
VDCVVCTWRVFVRPERSGCHGAIRCTRNFPALYIHLQPTSIHTTLDNLVIIALEQPTNGTGVPIRVRGMHPFVVAQCSLCAIVQHTRSVISLARTAIA